MELESKITIFESGIEEGIFSLNKKFYPLNSTESDIRKQFNIVKNRVGKTNKVDGNKFFQAHQKNENNGVDYPDGTYIVLKEENMQKEDFWDEDLKADILLLEEKYKGIVVGNQMADCPILIIEDRRQGVTALSHCGASYIDRELPKDTVKALQKEYSSKIDDLYVYVGSCAKEDSYIYETYPRWAKNNKIWNKNIIQKEDGYHINMNGAIRLQLEELGIKYIKESPIDTIKNDKYYSHYASGKGNKGKTGQNFVGFFYN